MKENETKMRKLNGTEIKTLFILSIVVPVSLLIVFRLTGILESPPTITEIETLEPVKWEFEKPAVSVGIKDKVESLYEGEITLKQQIFMDSYIEASEFGSLPKLTILPELAATLRQGYISNVNITFLDEYPYSLVELMDAQMGKPLTMDSQPVTVWENLSLTRYMGMSDLRGRTVKAFVDFDSVDHPKGILVSTISEWGLESAENQTRQLTVQYEVVYFNGTTYKKIVQPVQLRLIIDSNNSFEAAEEIPSEQFNKRYFLGAVDKVDFYKVCLEKGAAISIAMKTPPTGDFDLYLYEPKDFSRFVASSTNDGDGVEESIEHTIDSTGWWCIKVEKIGGVGIYTLGLNPILQP